MNTRATTRRDSGEASGRGPGSDRVWRDRWAAFAPWALAIGVALLVVVAFPVVELSAATLAFLLMMVFFAAFALHLSRSRSTGRPL